ncbi:BLUF domain-containing protein [Alkalicaulis satelles]|uniref:BLUF domain-containing protein n=1 Tax=Alkalicaulis satelles TaxID=2609175 RepID=A0A5M6ZD62_9PROT|nr:BLUF domain-containing protein [Alkalicaulis satelles]KAA5802255.1 BLUF domain-containing protein [Alkalicaulis satelles]
MFLTRFIYTSRPTFVIRPPDVCPKLKSLYEAGLAHNPANGITGVLAIDSGRFVQALEGSRSDVSRTIQRIIRDDRHTDIELVCMEEVSCRAFEDWAVAFLAPDDLPECEPVHAGDTGTMPSDALMQRLIRIRETGVIACRSVTPDLRAGAA